MAMTVRPFHETVVEAIHRASSAELGCLALLINATRIPKNHDEIIAAWNRRRESIGWEGENVFDVVTNVLEQKQEAEAQATDLASSFGHGGKERALMIVLEKAIGLLRDEPNNLSIRGRNVIFNLFESVKKISWAQTEQDFRAAIADL